VPENARVQRGDSRRLPRTSRNSFGPLRSLRFRRCRSSSVADGSLRRSISWPAISSALAAFLVRPLAEGALCACSVAMIDLHSPQTMPPGRDHRSLSSRQRSSAASYRRWGTKLGGIALGHPCSSPSPLPPPASPRRMRRLQHRYFVNKMLSGTD
jgi:hypothetical protein